MELPDEDIARSVQQGDIEQFGVLVERYEQKLMRYTQKFLRDSEDRSDILQDIFIKAYVNIQSFDASQKFSPWIYRIAHNEAINFLKKQKTNKSFSLFDVDVLFPHPVAEEKADTDAEREILKKMIDETLDDIDTKYREILLLYFYEDMSYKDIAQILHIPVSSVGVRIQRAKKLVEAKVGNKYTHQ